MEINETQAEMFSSNRQRECVLLIQHELTYASLHPMQFNRQGIIKYVPA